MSAQIGTDFRVPSIEDIWGDRHRMLAKSNPDSRFGCRELVLRMSFCHQSLLQGGRRRSAARSFG
ncbi:MAG: hypothetical protein ACE5FH_05700 [Candidatus Zixiibacteriota bacterium]